MILPQAVIEAGTLQISLNFNSNIKLEGNVNQVYLDDPSISISKQAEIMFINDKIFKMIQLIQKKDEQIDKKAIFENLKELDRSLEFKCTECIQIKDATLRQQLMTKLSECRQ